ncbi:hypothetical protein MTR_7g080123 [Medicago truncatula]|uniref:Uncharacterized protein n=1 Tax=Medicago truncatula TaxID=3880 RepID=A0A072U2N4_MEDTR|nr:hypothetical protein MTR_7g080123 [Medicago truncatula]
MSNVWTHIEFDRLQVGYNSEPLKFRVLLTRIPRTLVKKSTKEKCLPERYSI